MTVLLDWLGSGWAFPVAPDASLRHLRYSDGPEKVREAIRLILETEPGERVMRPTFGCGLSQFLMEPNNVATRTLIDQEVRRSLDTWEPRVSLQDVTVQTSEDPAVVLITIRYEHRRTGRTDMLVYPYAFEVPR